MSFLELVKALEKHEPIAKIKNLWLKNGKSVFKNEVRNLINDLDSLPFPEWRLFPPLKSYKTRSRKSPAAPVLTSRGCPFNCIYCSKAQFTDKIV